MHRNNSSFVAIRIQSKPSSVLVNVLLHDVLTMHTALIRIHRAPPPESALRGKRAARILLLCD